MRFPMDPGAELDADDFFERQRLRGRLADLRQELASATGSNRNTLERQVADVEERIRVLTSRLPSALR